jgi:hypothetical protein
MDNLKWDHIRPIKENENKDTVAAKIIVYAEEDEECFVA